MSELHFVLGCGIFIGVAVMVAAGLDPFLNPKREQAFLIGAIFVLAFGAAEIAVRFL